MCPSCPLLPPLSPMRWPLRRPLSHPGLQRVAALLTPLPVPLASRHPLTGFSGHSHSSSESEMEEEEPPLPTSDLGGVPWKEAVRIHALLRGKSEEELEASRSFGAGEEDEEDEEEEEEEEEDEEEDEEDEESSEGQRTPSPPDPDVRPQCAGVGSCGWGPMTDASLPGLGGPVMGRQGELGMEAGQGLLQLRSFVFLSCSS